MALCRVTGSANGSVTGARLSSTRCRGATGLYWTGLLRLWRIMVLSGATCLELVVIVKLARNPCPGGVGCFIILTSTRSSMFGRLPVDEPGQRWGTAIDKEKDTHLICMFSSPSPLSVSCVSQ